MYLQLRYGRISKKNTEKVIVIYILSSKYKNAKIKKFAICDLVTLFKTRLLRHF
jgi:hypothetical protein